MAGHAHPFIETIPYRATDYPSHSSRAARLTWFELPLFASVPVGPMTGGVSIQITQPPGGLAGVPGGVLGSGSVFFDCDNCDNCDTVDFIGFFCPQS